MTPQSPSNYVPWDLTQFSQSPSASPSYFPESHQRCEVFSLPKVIIVLGKARSHKAPNLCCRGAESPGWSDVSPWDMIYEWACCHDEAANHQLPISAGFWIIWIVSTEECSSLTQNLMQIHCSTRSVILNAIATPYTCSLSSVYRPHWLVQWCLHCSCVRIPVHSPWLPGYVNAAQTVLVILKTAGLFLDRHHIHLHIYVYIHIIEK